MTRINNSLAKDSSAYDALSKIANTTYAAGAKTAPYLVSAASITAKITTIGVAAILERVFLYYSFEQGVPSGAPSLDSLFAIPPAVATPIAAMDLYHLFNSIEKRFGANADTSLEKKVIPCLISTATTIAKITTTGVAATLEAGLLYNLFTIRNASIDENTLVSVDGTLLIATPLVAAGLYYLFNSVEKRLGIEAASLLEKTVVPLDNKTSELV
jgi:hypothetical protein